MICPTTIQLKSIRRLPGGASPSALSGLEADLQQSSRRANITSTQPIFALTRGNAAQIQSYPVHDGLGRAGECLLRLTFAASAA